MNNLSPERIAEIAAKQDEKAKAIKAAKSEQQHAEEEEAARMIQVCSRLTLVASSHTFSVKPNLLTGPFP